MKTLKNMCYLTLSVLLLVACSKDGDQGPVGPQGPQGVQGESGPAGSDGQDGADGVDGVDGEDGATGTANVIFSEWIDSTFDNNIAASGAGINIEAELLTQEIIDDGIVMVYARNEEFLTGNDVFPLPQIISNRQHAFRLEEVGTIRITILSLDGSSIGSPFFESYRYVLIPGGQTTEGNDGPGGIETGKSSVDFSKMTYEETMAHFNIPE